jgi:hypothetical protein
VNPGRCKDCSEWLRDDAEAVVGTAGITRRAPCGNIESRQWMRVTSAATSCDAYRNWLRPAASGGPVSYSAHTGALDAQF